MDRIALIIGENFLYWSSILLTLGAAVSVLVFLGVYLGRGGSVAAGALAVPVSLGLSLVLARLVHWYCCTNSYTGFAAAMTDYSSGGFALSGVFAGCFMAAVLLRVVGISRNLPGMLDAMSLAGGAGIAVGRLASFFNTTDRGLLVQSVKSLPWVYPMANAVSGAEEYRLATFLIQAMLAAAIVAVLLPASAILRKKGRMADGDTCVIFLLCYGASQVLLDSTRYDSLYFRFNGFISIVQVLGALAIGLAAVLFSVRLVRNKGWSFKYLGLWLPIAALLGLGGYMEYHVQRHGNEALFAYSVMSLCLVGLVIFCLVIYGLSVSGKQKPAKRKKPSPKQAAPAEEPPAGKQASSGKNGGRFLRENRTGHGK